jgi:hypothetical protein
MGLLLLCDMYGRLLVDGRVERRFQDHSGYDGSILTDLM